jgi:AcrR family transcriptional regulator
MKLLETSRTAGEAGMPRAAGGGGAGRRAEDAEAGTGGVRDRILSEAQSLFAEHGYAGTSTRAIAQAAGVNLAQLHYYFGAKRDLFKAAYRRGAAQVTEARRAALAAAQAEFPDGAIPLERLVRAFVEPFMLNTTTPEGRATMQMHARLHTEPEDIGKEVLSQVYDETTLAYTESFRRALPHLSFETICWRLYFMMGAYRYTLMRTGRLEAMSGGLCDSGDFHRALEEIVPFLAAGLRAAPPPRGG